MKTVKELFDLLSKVIPQEEFLSCGLANGEVPFYVCPYDIADDAAMNEAVRLLAKNLLTKHNIRVQSLYLPEVIVDVLKKNGDYDWLIQHEAEFEKDSFYQEIVGLLDVESELVPEIAARIESERPQVLFLTGIGNCYPFLRAHTLLSNLDTVVKDFPLIMFFPGRYQQIPGSGASLHLFGTLTPNGYYRAFSVEDLKA